MFSFLGKSGLLLLLLGNFYINNVISQTSYTGDALCDYIDAHLQCLNDPCDCDGADFDNKCINCQDSGCVQCKIDTHFLHNEADKKCIKCNKISNCLHCTDNTGCQQCDTSNDPTCVLTEAEDSRCGLRTCQCSGNGNNTPNPTPHPIPAPTESPSKDPTEQPTVQPTADVSSVPSIQTSVTDLLTGSNPTSVEYWFAENAEICWGDYPCDGGETWLKFGGICNEGTISTVGYSVFMVDRNIWEFYRSCEQTELGLFWMKGMACFVFTQNGLIQRAYINFDEYDVLKPIFEEYLILTNQTIDTTTVV